MTYRYGEGSGGREGIGERASSSHRAAPAGGGSFESWRGHQVLCHRAGLGGDCSTRSGVALKSRLAVLETRLSAVEREQRRTEGLIDGLRGALTGANATD